jgi:hypothetical protein
VLELPSGHSHSVSSPGIHSVSSEFDLSSSELSQLAKNMINVTPKVATKGFMKSLHKSFTAPERDGILSETPGTITPEINNECTILH